VARDLQAIGVRSVPSLLSDLVARERDVPLEGARIQTDDGLHLEFQAPLGFYRRSGLTGIRWLPPVPDLSDTVRGIPAAWADSRAKLRRAALVRAEGGNPAAAMELLAQALRSFPDSRQARHYLDAAARECIAMSDRTGSVAALEGIPPESVWYVQARLRIIGRLTDRARLIEEHRKILAVAPDNEGAVEWLVERLLEDGDREEADTVTRNAVERDPGSERLQRLRERVMK
jgi:tetratricopeptide (TPR) repeat protein